MLTVGFWDDCGKSSNMCSFSLHYQSSKYLSIIIYLHLAMPYFISECVTFTVCLIGSQQYQEQYKHFQLIIELQTYLWLSVKANISHLCSKITWQFSTGYFNLKYFLKMWFYHILDYHIRLFFKYEIVLHLEVKKKEARVIFEFW